LVDIWWKEEVRGMNVYPTILKDVFWEDVKAGFPDIQYLGYDQYEPGE
jgi:hypothetical protein